MLLLHNSHSPKNHLTRLNLDLLHDYSVGLPDGFTWLCVNDKMHNYGVPYLHNLFSCTLECGFNISFFFTGSSQCLHSSRYYH